MSSTLLEAVLAVQGAVPTIPKDKTASVTTKTGRTYQYAYATLDTIVEKVGPLLAEHGLVWLTFPGRNDAGELILTYRLAHAASGDRLEGVMPLLGTITGPQELGSALTYARRYALCAVLNLVADVDDDGQTAEGHAPASPPATAPKPKPAGATDAQRRKIHVLLKERGVGRDELEAILAPAGVELGEGWLDRLTPGRDGTASALIATLEQRTPPEGV